MLALGTVRISRLPGCSLKTDEGLKKLGRGADDYTTEAGTNGMALKWYDNKPVYLVSSYKGRHPVETVKRWSVARRQYVELPRPEMKEYNCHMGGVDLQDMLVALYRTNIRVKRYYLHIGFHLLDMCVLNVWLPVAYPGILFGGVSTNSVEDRGQRERGSGGGSPLVRGSGGSCNLVQVISFHMVKFS